LYVFFHSVIFGELYWIRLGSIWPGPYRQSPEIEQCMRVNQKHEPSLETTSVLFMTCVLAKGGTIFSTTDWLQTAIRICLHLVSNAQLLTIQSIPKEEIQSRPFFHLDIGYNREEKTIATSLKIMRAHELKKKKKNHVHG